MTAEPRRMRVVRAGDRAEHDVGGRHREVIGVVFADPEEVHPDLVGKDALFDDIADRLGVREPVALLVVGEVAEGVEAEDQRELPGFDGGRWYRVGWCCAHLGLLSGFVGAWSTVPP